MASTDTLEDNTKFAQMHEADFPILADPDLKAGTAYGVIPEGRKTASRWTFYIGPDGKIIYIDKSIKTSSAGADVAARLGALGVAKR